MRLVLCLALGLAIGFVGCKKSDEVVIRKLLVDIEPGAEGPTGVLTREVVRAIVEDALRAESKVKLQLDDGDGEVLRVRIESAALAPSIAAAEKGRGTLSLSVELSSKSAEGRRQRYSGSSVASASGTVDYRALVRQSFGEAFLQVRDARGAAGQDTEVLLTWLDDKTLDSSSQRLQAIRVLGARREAKARDGLVGALKSADDETAQAALGALTLLGDAAAAPAVIEYAESKPARIRKQAIEAARVMGGKLSASWLFTLSTGHPDDDVQSAAAAALAQLEARSAPAGGVAQVEPQSKSAPN